MLPVDAAVLVPAPKLRPPLSPGVKDVVVPNAGVVVVAPALKDVIIYHFYYDIFI